MNMNGTNNEDILITNGKHVNIATVKVGGELEVFPHDKLMGGSKHFRKENLLMPEAPNFDEYPIDDDNESKTESKKDSTVLSRILKFIFNSV